MCNTSLQGWKGMPFINFKIVNAKNSKMELKKKRLKYGISIHWDFNH